MFHVLRSQLKEAWDQRTCSTLRVTGLYIRRVCSPLQSSQYYSGGIIKKKSQPGGRDQLHLKMFLVGAYKVTLYSITMNPRNNKILKLKRD